MSSATGDLFDNHDVISLKVYEIELDSADAIEDSAFESLPVGIPKHEGEELPESKDSDAEAESGRGGGAGGIFKVFLALVVVAAIVGIVIYFRKEDKAKRFY